jgi:hypothetical protein
MYNFISLVFFLFPTLAWSFVVTNLADWRGRHALSLAKSEIPAVYPMSTRAALIQKAKEIDENIAKGERTGTYSPAGWSNRLGTTLTPVAIPGVYTADRPFYWNKIDVGCRMTVIQLENGDLWVHSPVFLDNPLKNALDKLGTVRFVVSPNYEHLKFAPMWHKAYPNAHMWGCPGLAERMPEIKWAGEVPANELRPDNQGLKNCWDFDTIRPCHVHMEVNPFTGTPFFNEVIFYHVPSRSLVTTDFYWNYPTSDGIPNSNIGEKEWELAPAVEEIPVGSKLWKFGMDKVFYPFYKKFMIKDKSKYDEMVKIILGEWEIETVIPAHGDPIHGKSLVRLVLKSFLE